MSLKPGRENLERLLRGCGIELRSEQVDTLWTYHCLLRAANAELNLTRIHNFTNMVLKHYVDSLLVLKFEELPSPLIDMGSGPGLPGIPLKIARPEVSMILAEPRGQRVEFLKRVCESLRLRDIEVHAGKVGPKYTRPVSGVITRAVASIPDTLERVANCLQPGGRMLFMKGPECDNEIADARASHGDTFRLLADHAYKIPRTPHQRRLLVYERLTAPSCSIGEAIRSQPAKAVTSPANPTFKLLFDLLNARGIRKHGQALMMGSRPVREVLAQFPDRVLGWITDTGGEAPPLRPGAEPIEWIRLADPLFRDLDMFGTHAPLLLVRVHEFPDWSDQAPWPEGCTLFLPFQDPENVGAVIRTAAAFGVARVVLLREAAHPFHPKAVRAAGTTLLQVRLERGPSINDLIVRGAPLIALDTCGPVLASQPFPFSFGLVVGIEGPGLPPRLREGLRRRIPIAPEVESLNAAAATAVALYEWRRANSL